VLADIARDAVQYDRGIDSDSLEIFALIHHGTPVSHIEMTMFGGLPPPVASS
jgi:hypothetical protein